MRERAGWRAGEDIAGIGIEVAGVAAPAADLAPARIFSSQMVLQRECPVPVWGTSSDGSTVESWCSPELIQRGWTAYETFFENQQSEHFEKHPQVVASTCYENMLRHLIPFAFRGTISYQGEGNSSRSEEHKTLLPAMITEFRENFRRADMPFYFVQLPRLEKSNWEAIRRAQLHIWENTPETFMAVTIDLPRTFPVGNNPIHPNVKRPVGERLAGAARHFVYGERDVVPSGPRFKEVESSEGQTILRFEYTGEGLSSLDGEPLRGLYAGPPGGPLKPVVARIEGNTLVIDHAINQLNLPILIRYGSELDMGTEELDVNLGNSEKLPASPFLTKALKP